MDYGLYYNTNISPYLDAFQRGYTHKEEYTIQHRHWDVLKHRNKTSDIRLNQLHTHTHRDRTNKYKNNADSYYTL